MAITAPTPTGSVGAHTTEVGKTFDINDMLEESLLFQQLERTIENDAFLTELGMISYNKQAMVKKDNYRNTGTKTIIYDFEKPTSTIVDDTDLALPKKEQVKVKTKELVFDKILKINQTYNEVKWDLPKISAFMDSINTSRLKALLDTTTTDGIMHKLNESSNHFDKNNADEWNKYLVPQKSIRENLIAAYTQAITNNSSVSDLLWVLSPQLYTEIIKTEEFIAFNEQRVEKMTLLNNNSFVAGTFLGIKVVVSNSVKLKIPVEDVVYPHNTIGYLIDKSAIWCGIIEEEVFNMSKGFSGSLQNSLYLVDYFGFDFTKGMDPLGTTNNILTISISDELATPPTTSPTSPVEEKNTK